MKRWRIVGAAAIVALVGSSLGAVAPSPAAEPERSLTTPTGWWWYPNASADFLTNKVNSEGARIIDIEVRKVSPTRFTAALVHNSGVHASDWWWYPELSAQELSDKLAELGARILDLETYKLNGNRRFAAVLIPNSGERAKAWWWYYGVSAKFISERLNENKARLIDLDTYVAGGKRRYAVVMVDNTDADATKWWWYYNVTPAFINNKLKSKRARLVDIERHRPGRFSVVMERTKDEQWWWYYGHHASKLHEKALQNGARVFDIEFYKEGKKRRYAALMLNNVDDETARLRELMRPGLESGNFGFYVKRVGGPKVTGLMDSWMFEPASAMKTVHHAYTMRQVFLENDFLTSPFDYYVDPDDPTNKDVCPRASHERDSNKITTTLLDGVSKMMQVSDNRTTQGVVLRSGDGDHEAGLSTLNGFMDSLSMTDSELSQRLGCGFRGGLRNDYTLVDAGKLFEAIEDGTLLSGVVRDDFYDIMSGGQPGNNFKIIVEEEAAVLGKSAVVDDFMSATERRSKGGSYDICVKNDCKVGYRYYRAEVGRISIPHRIGRVIDPVGYVYGRFANGQLIPCEPKVACAGKNKTDAGFSAVAAEMFRTAIREALVTW
jgi:hypothetical protein